MKKIFLLGALFISWPAKAFEVAISESQSPAPYYWCLGNTMCFGFSDSTILLAGFIITVGVAVILVMKMKRTRK